MNIETNIFNCLLEVSDIYDIYKKIGETINTQTDIVSIGFSRKALQNTISLLLNLQIIQKEENHYSKAIGYKKYDIFCNELLSRIEEHYKDIIIEIFTCDKKYDSVKNQFFIYKNDVPLRIMGLLMLMEQVGVFEECNSKDYIVDINKYRHYFKNKSKIDSDEFKKILQHEAELGEIAEQFAIVYENKKLDNLNISKRAIRISDVDVTAGYDIISYMYDTDIPNKYIEVKSCNGNFDFYISRNEINVSKEKGDSYFLYLYNRDKKTIYEIQNPYLKIFKENSDWGYEAESFHINKRNHIS